MQPKIKILVNLILGQIQPSTNLIAWYAIPVLPHITRVLFYIPQEDVHSPCLTKILSSCVGVSFYVNHVEFHLIPIMMGFILICLIPLFTMDSISLSQLCFG